MRNIVFLLASVLLLALAGPGAAAGPDDRLFYAVESMLRGRASQAVEALTEVVAADPDNAYALSRLGLAQADLGQTGPARRTLEKALAERGDNVFALWTLGCLDLVDGQPEKARERFATLHRTDPGNARGPLGLGLAEVLAGRPREAVPLLAQTQGADSPDPQVHYLTGLAYWLLDAPINARLELEAALEREPRNVQTLDLLGLVYRRQGKSGLAQGAWEQSLLIRPDDARARFCLSRLAQDDGLAAQLDDRMAEARRAYARALELDRTNEGAAQALSRLAPASPAPEARPGRG